MTLLCCTLRQRHAAGAAEEAEERGEEPFVQHTSRNAFASEKNVPKKAEFVQLTEAARCCCSSKSEIPELISTQQTSRA